MMKIAVVGAGYWGKKHVEELTKLNEDVIVVDIDPKNRKYCKERFNVKVFDNHKKILKDKDLKAVIICTPNATHYRICRDFLISGKHVLVEKPLATKKEHINALISLAKDNKVSLSVGHLFRFNNSINKVKEMVREGYLGDIYIVKMKWINNEFEYQQDFYKRIGDRDVIDDLVLHPFDILNFIFEKNPDEFSC